MESKIKNITDEIDMLMEFIEELKESGEDDTEAKEMLAIAKAQLEEMEGKEKKAVKQENEPKKKKLSKPSPEIPLERMNMKELRDIAKKEDLRGYSSLTKKSLIEAIRGWRKHKKDTDDQLEKVRKDKKKENEILTKPKPPPKPEKFKDKKVEKPKSEEKPKVEKPKSEEKPESEKPKSEKPESSSMGETRRRRNFVRDNYQDFDDFSNARKREIADIIKKGKNRTPVQNAVLDKAYEEMTSPPIRKSEPAPQLDNPVKQGNEIGVKTDILEAQKKIEKRDRGIPKLQFPSTTIILAKKFSGKTNLILNLFDKDDFDNVWVVSGTGHLGRLDQLCEDEDCLLENVSEDMLKELIKMHQEEPMNSLIIFDDVIGQVFMNSKQMQKLASMGRNYGVSICISAQDFFKVPPIWRRNSENWFLGAMTDSNADAVSKELAISSMPKRKINEVLRDITRDKDKSFLYYDDRNSDFRLVSGKEMKVFF